MADNPATHDRYDHRDDRDFGRRFMLAILIALIPLGIVLCIAGLLQWPVWLLISVLVATLIIALTLIAIRDNKTGLV